MALAKRVFEEQANEAEVFNFFSQEEIQKNLTFLMLVETLFDHSKKANTDFIKVIDPQDENNVLYYTNDKFLEIIDLYGLDGFIY